MYFKKLIGTKCYLSPIDLADAPKYAEWWNDQEVTKYLANHHIINLDKQKENLGFTSKKHNYSIINIENDELVGDVGLQEINQINRSAEIGIIIGNKKYLHKGYATEAIKLLINYAINNLNINSINLRVYSKNINAIKCYEKIGFKKSGKLRHAAFVNGAFDDIIIMDLLAKEFK